LIGLKIQLSGASIIIELIPVQIILNNILQTQVYLRRLTQTLLE